MRPSDTFLNGIVKICPKCSDNSLSGYFKCQVSSNCKPAIRKQTCTCSGAVQTHTSVLLLGVGSIRGVVSGVQGSPLNAKKKKAECQVQSMCRHVFCISIQLLVSRLCQVSLVSKQLFGGRKRSDRTQTLHLCGVGRDSFKRDMK